MNNKIYLMGHVMLSHHAKNKFLLQLKCHITEATLEDGSPITSISNSTNQPFGCVFLNQTPLLHKDLSYYTSKIIYISTFNNTFKCE